MLDAGDPSKASRIGFHGINQTRPWSFCKSKEAFLHAWIGLARFARTMPWGIWVGFRPDSFCWRIPTWIT